MVFQDTIKLFQTDGGAYEITSLISELIAESDIKTGTCHLFVHSSVASLLIADFADDSMKNDTASFLADLVPSTDENSERINQGMNEFSVDMRYALSQNSLTIPVSNNHPGIGIWQGIYLWDSSQNQTERKITVTITGE